MSYRFSVTAVQRRVSAGTRLSPSERIARVVPEVLSVLEAHYTNSPLSQGRIEILSAELDQ